METNRRSFITGLGALFAAATIPGTAQALPKSDIDRLLDTLKNGGTIENMEFRFYAGETLKITAPGSVTIHNCVFKWFGKKPKVLMDVAGAGGVTLTYSTFDTSECEPGPDVWRLDEMRRPYLYHDALPLKTV